MPNPLKSIYDAATTPLVPKSAIAPAQQALEEPHLDQSPMMARLKGFGSGALEGLRGLTSPLDLAANASLVAGPGLRAARGARAGVGAIEGLTGALRGPEAASELGSMGGMMEKMAAENAPTFSRLKQAGTFAGDRSTGAIQPLARTVIPSSEFAPATEMGEALYNSGRPAAGRGPNPLDAVYQRIQANKGRAMDQTGKISPGLGAAMGAGGAGLAYGGSKIIKGLMNGGEGTIQKNKSERDRLMDEIQGIK